MTLLDLCDQAPAIEGTDFTAAVAAYLHARPNQWVDGHTLMQVGGTFAFRTRVSEARKRYGMTIENRVSRVQRDGRRWVVTEYRYVPAHHREHGA